MIYLSMVIGAIFITIIIVYLIKRFQKAYQVPLKELILAEVAFQNNDPRYISAIVCFYLKKAVTLTEQDSGQWIIEVQDGHKGVGKTAREALENMLEEECYED